MSDAQLTPDPGQHDRDYSDADIDDVEFLDAQKRPVSDRESSDFVADRIENLTYSRESDKAPESEAECFTPEKVGANSGLTSYG